MIEAEDFADWDKMEDAYIKALTGETKTNHIFYVDINRNNGNLMFLQLSDGSIETKLVLVRPLYHNQDATFWKEMQPQLLPALGIQDIKWRESRTVHGNDDKPTKATKDEEPKQHDLKLDDNATGII